MPKTIPKTKAGKRRAMADIMEEFKAGEMRRADGVPVTSRKEALARALSQTGQSRPKAKRKRAVRAKKRPATRGKMRRA